MSSIKIDMNNPEFQRDLFELEKEEQIALIKTLRKISQLNWQQLYTDKGLKWEAIISKHAKSGEHIYTFRFSKKFRATALRQNEFIRLLTLHVDHDSAYK